MRTETQEKLLKILFKALKPLVHMLLESGIGHREFSQVAKMAFVDVATKNYGIRGRDTNISRVAVMTGLTRKEVKRVRDSLADTAEDMDLKPLPASTVLHKWATDPDFLDDASEPRVLPFDSGRNSFHDLVRKYAGDIPPGAIRTELKRTGAIKADPDGSLRMLRRDYFAGSGSEGVVRAISRPLTGLLMALEHNTVLKQLRGSESESWPEVIVQITLADEKHRSKVRKLIAKKTTEFWTSLDDELANFNKGAIQSMDHKKPKVSVAVGAYYFESIW